MDPLRPAGSVGLRIATRAGDRPRSTRQVVPVPFRPLKIATTSEVAPLPTLRVLLRNYVVRWQEVSSSLTLIRRARPDQSIGRVPGREAVGVRLAGGR